MSTEAAPSIDLSGQIVLGRYQLLRLLGEGGMGRAYQALLIKGDGQEVVVKVMHERFLANPRFHEMFEREMTFLRQFEHPHVVALYDSGVDPKVGPCIVMEYLDGVSLSDLIDRNVRLDPERTGRLLLQLCSALQSAADQGIIHRDLKPSNLMIVNPDTDDEYLKVLDFGLAKMAAAPHLAIEELRGSQRRIVAVGTPEYLCPEQIRGNEVDARGDLYSVGIILFEMLTGRRPFKADLDSELFDQHLRAEPPTFEQLGLEGVAPEVEHVVRLCLQKYPMDRPASAAVLAQYFEIALGHELTEEGLATLNNAPTPAEAGRSPLDEALAKLDNPFAVVLRLQAWMPEKIAVLKLRGFLDDMCGEVTESVPGRVHVRMRVETEPPPPQTAPAVMVWLGLAPKPKAPKPPDVINFDIYMEKKDPTQPNLLSITAVIEPPEESELVRMKLWKRFTDKLENGLKEYLIAEKVPDPA